MATTLYLAPNATVGDNSNLPYAYDGGFAYPRIGGSDVKKSNNWLTTARVGTAGSYTQTYITSVAGPTSGLEYDTFHWSAPLAAGVTISGSATFNLWARESDMTANAAVNVRLWKADAATGAITNFYTTTRTTELGTSLGAENYTFTPTSTTFNAGDRIGLSVFMDDAGTMGSGFSLYIAWNNGTAGGTGDSYITFTETLSFVTSAPSGSTLYFTNTTTTGLTETGYVCKDIWTARPTGSTATVSATQGSPATDGVALGSGGSIYEWFTRPLNAVTIDGVVSFHLECWANANTGNLCVELAVTNNDGSGATAIGYGGWANFSGGYFFYSTGGNYANFYLGVAPATLTDGQRLRFRVFTDDGTYLMANTTTATFQYAGSSSGGSGDSYAILNNTISEYTGATSSDSPYPYAGGGYYGG